MEFSISEHCAYRTRAFRPAAYLRRRRRFEPPLDTADGPADNKTQGCRSDHYFSQDLNQGGENDPPRSEQKALAD